MSRLKKTLTKSKEKIFDINEIRSLSEIKKKSKISLTLRDLKMTKYNEDLLEDSLIDSKNDEFVDKHFITEINIAKEDSKLNVNNSLI